MRPWLTIVLLISTLLAGTPTTARPVSGQAVAEAGTLRAMLRLMPLSLGGDVAPMLIYANLALQAEAAGVAIPAADAAAGSDRDAWLTAISRLSLPSLGIFMNLPQWRESFGFSLVDVDQMVQLTAPPSGVTLIRGRFEPESLVRRWAADGYQRRASSRGEYFTAGGDFQANRDSPGSSMVLGQGSYLAVLGPEMIAFASTERLITDALDLSAGAGTALADEISMASLLAGVPDDLATAVIMDGEQFQPFEPSARLGAPAAGTAEPAGEGAAVSEMPPLSLVLLGETTGGPLRPTGDNASPPVSDLPDAQAIAVIVTSSDDAARTAAAVIDGRLQASGRGPVLWSEFFSAWRTSVVEGEPVVVVEFKQAGARGPMILANLAYRRQLTFLLWSP